MTDKINELEQIINDALSSDSEGHSSWIIEEIEDIMILKEIQDEWIDDGKYSYGTFICMIQYKDEEYVIETSQSRNGSYHTDYYYNEATLTDIQLASNYFSPKVVFEFNYKNKVVSIYDNKEIKVDSEKFENVELAIDFILKNS